MLNSFDFVVASVHSRFRLDAKTQADRIVRAVSNPFTTILGHLTGRMLLRRPGYEVDIDAILGACAEYGVAVQSMRTPTGSTWTGDGIAEPWNWAACSASTLTPLTRWGVLMARKGGIAPERVLNSLNLKEITAFLQARRAARSPDRRLGCGKPRPRARRELEPFFERQRRLAGFIPRGLRCGINERYGRAPA